MKEGAVTMKNVDIVRRLVEGGSVPTVEINKRLDILCRGLLEKQTKGAPQVIVMNYGDPKMPLRGGQALDHHCKSMVAKMKMHIQELDVPVIADIIEIMILLVYREQHKVINFQTIQSRLQGCQKAQAAWQMACGM
ncbi:hypothetical protein A3I35_00645 [Candidatus Falkowbacteria bacterium RIFCSPLOWO2_02_FULL_45_15]|uniref:Uncharacterized protein n=2 Tax=Candidatus Falkowiibacteriota TaxID=1752728 RepID=A0A1F5RWG5_9BACT|nr:MAG: hypothetical protein A3I35_00645 [Candidatus Falkowbacteria bacterium RIFCSPLOWO2_02_FULL_45_15]